MVDSTRLAGKIALITGASSGIGAATAKRFLAEGAVVIAASLEGSRDPLAAEMPERVVGVDLDVTDSAQVAAVVELVRARFGRLDILVNNAGITGTNGRIHEYDPDEWDRVMDVNVRGAFLMMRSAIPLMMAGGGGSIVNLGSVGSFVYAGGSTAYPPSKAAIVMLTKQVAIDYIKDGIRANAVCPGIVETPLLSNAPVGLDVLAGFVPMGRLGRPDEIAAFIALLASDESAFATGGAYLIDGGQTAV